MHFLFRAFSFLFLLLLPLHLSSQDYSHDDIKQFIDKAKSGSWKTDDKDILQLVEDNKYSLTVAHYLALYNHNWSTDDTQILKLKNNNGDSVAQILAINNKNFSTDDTQILRLKNNKGATVAHYLALYNHNWSTDDTQILKLKNNDGDSVAHYFALFNPNWNTDNSRILNLNNNDNYTVAHFLALFNPNWNTDNSRILNLNTNDGYTVSSFLSFKHNNYLDLSWNNTLIKLLAQKARTDSWSTDNTLILQLVVPDHNRSWTIAHFLAKYNPNWSTQDKDILMLKDARGSSVAHFLAKHHPSWSTDDPDILELKYDKYHQYDNYNAYIYVKGYLYLLNKLPSSITSVTLPIPDPNGEMDELSREHPLEITFPYPLKLIDGDTICQKVFCGEAWAVEALPTDTESLISLYGLKLHFDDNNNISVVLK